MTAVDFTACLNAADVRLVGDPVDTLTGAVIDEMLDFRLTGPIELRWKRHYSSLLADQSFGVGRGCGHEYERTLVLEDTGLVFEEAVRRRLRFPRLVRDGTECAFHGFTLRRLTASVYRLQEHAQATMEFTFLPGSRVARLSRLLRDGAIVQFVYDTAMRLVAILDSAGRHLSAQVDSAGRLTRLSVEPAGSSPGWLLIEYGYDSQGNLVSTRNGAGHGYAFAYDESNRMVRRRGRSGFQFHFKYDAKGRCTLAGGDGGLFGVALDYAVPGRITKVTRPDRGVWTYRFSTGGELESVANPMGGVHRYVRDERGRLLLEIDANGNTTSFIYDSTGAAVHRIGPFGRWTDLPMDPSAADADFHRVAANPAEYSHGRLPDLAKVEIPAGTDLIRLPLSPTVRSLVSTRKGSGAGPRNPQWFEVPPLRSLWWPPPSTGRAFSALGKLVEQHDSFDRVRSWTYDESGNPCGHVDFDGGRWHYEYGLWHFMTRFSNPIGAEVRCTYTEYGLLSSCTDAGQTRHEYGYDLNGHLVEVRRHGVVRDRYVRDHCGNLVAKHASDGTLLMRLEIGPGNLPKVKMLASGDEHSFEYDPSGRYLRVATQLDVVDFRYDDFGNCTAETRNGCGVEYSFDGPRAPTAGLLMHRFAVGYRRVAEGVMEVTDPLGGVQTITQLGHGLLELRLSSGSTEVCQLDDRGRYLFKCTQRRHRNEVWIRRYQWSGEGELRCIDDSHSGTTHYQYDAAHRLRLRIADGTSEEFELDLADNLLKQPGLRDVVLLDGNRLHSANGFEFSYNARNHVERRGSPRGLIEYHYDSRDQLVRAEWPGARWEAHYDALGRRTQKIFNGQKTEFYWYSDQLVAEVNHLGRLRLYIYSDSLAATPLLFIDYRTSSAPAEEGSRYFIFADQVGAPSLIEDDFGTSVWRANISPYGMAEIDPQSTIDFNLRLPGQYFDAELELHYNRFRYYDPVLGRYLQSDPWGISGGTNLYAYRTNPLLVADIRGLGEEHGPDGKKVPKDEEGNHVSPLTGEPVEGSIKVCQKSVDGEVVARYYIDDQGRTVRAEGLLDPPSSYKKSGVGHVEPDGFESGRDHRGHLIPERSAASQSAVNVPENVIAEHGTKSNLSEKKKWENSARDHAENNPGTWSVHEPHYDGDNPRPSSVTHGLHDSDGDPVPNTQKTIPNPED